MTIQFHAEDRTSVQHECDFSNVNAYELLRLIAPEDLAAQGSCGQWDVDQLPVICRRIIYVLNTGRAERAVREPSMSGGDGRCTMYDMGSDIDAVRRRLNSLLYLCTMAHEVQSKVYWA